ncbi:hypothetical protein T440DRAFT_479545 [Plenodomus tracheiphilus IPT5]|uniref:Uncharacterized protein n=1 Tax=Plenodomus tracheiphilus IPT5 TaxID=1408161 RepID=A0A6A7B3L8_9PLEO|nr:hypothetical protein T440DRAFT_479545 [Plenodomus tracheiphilus IPT5]
METAGEGSTEGGGAALEKAGGPRSLCRAGSAGSPVWLKGRWPPDEFLPWRAACGRRGPARWAPSARNDGQGVRRRGWPSARSEISVAGCRGGAARPSTVDRCRASTQACTGVHRRGARCAGGTAVCEPGGPWSTTPPNLASLAAAADHEGSRCRMQPGAALAPALRRELCTASPASPASPLRAGRRDVWHGYLGMLLPIIVVIIITVSIIIITTAARCLLPAACCLLPAACWACTCCAQLRRPALTADAIIIRHPGSEKHPAPTRRGHSTRCGTVALAGRHARPPNQDAARSLARLLVRLGVGGTDLIRYPSARAWPGFPASHPQTRLESRAAASSSSSSRRAYPTRRSRTTSRLHHTPRPLSTPSDVDRPAGRPLSDPRVETSPTSNCYAPPEHRCLRKGIAPRRLLSAQRAGDHAAVVETRDSPHGIEPLHISS